MLCGEKQPDWSMGELNMLVRFVRAGQLQQFGCMPDNTVFIQCTG